MNSDKCRLSAWNNFYNILSGSPKHSLIFEAKQKIRGGGRGGYGLIADKFEDITLSFHPNPTQVNG